MGIARQWAAGARIAAFVAMILWLLFNALVATALLAVETDKARRKVRWLFDQPLSFWEWIDRNRRMLKRAHEAMLNLKSFPEARPINFEGGTVKFRRPPQFQPKGN